MTRKAEAISDLIEAVQGRPGATNSHHARWRVGQPGEFRASLGASHHYYGSTLKLSDIGFRAVREPVQTNGGN